MFRPCIDLHGGKVKQIVGGTLSDDGDARPKENFVSERSSAEFAQQFRQDELRGGHVIKLGPGNDEAAREALAAWPGGLQIGGGITIENAHQWLEAGASHVIVTSSVFSKSGEFLPDALAALSASVGAERLVLDLSCKRHLGGWWIAMDRWQTITDLELTPGTLSQLATLCDEFLIHAADVEGLCGGMDVELVEMLGEWAANAPTQTPITYAGGIRSLHEIDAIQAASGGRVHYTVGSALDLFGGTQLAYQELVRRSVG